MAEAERAFVLKGVADHPEGQEAGAVFSVDLFDDLYLLLQGEIDGRVIVPGDGWNVIDYVSFILGAAGFPRDQYLSTLENLGVATGSGTNWGPGRLNRGYDEHLWVPEEGRTWMRYLQEILTYSADAALWIAPGTDAFGGGSPVPRVYTGCRWCHTLLRSANPDDTHYYMRHLSNGPASAGCLEYDLTRAAPDPDGVDYHIYTRAAKCPAALLTEHIKQAARDVAIPRVSRRDQYYNRITVKGPRERHQGSTDQMVAYADVPMSIDGDPDADVPLGFVRNLPIGAKWVTTWPIAKRVLLQEFYRRTYPPRFVEVPIPLQPEVRPSEVFALHGAEREAVDGTKWRITKVEHHIEGPEMLGMTSLTGWYIGDLS